MYWALDETDGQLVTLQPDPRFASQNLVRKRWHLIAPLVTSRYDTAKQRESAIEKVRAILNEKIFCPECLNPVYIYALNKALMHTSRERTLSQGRSFVQSQIRDVSFSHYEPDSPRNTGPVKTCSHYKPFDMRFIDRVKSYPKDPDVKKKVRASVLDKRIGRMNYVVLKHLHGALTAQPFGKNFFEKYENLYVNNFSYYEPLIDHPYLLPYLIMLGVGEQWNIKGGMSRHAQFVESGEIGVISRKSDGRVREVTLPQALRLQFRFVGRQQWIYAPETPNYYVSERASLDLAGMPSAQPTKTHVMMVPSDMVAGQAALLSDVPAKTPQKPEKMGKSKPTNVTAIQLSFGDM